MELVSCHNSLLLGYTEITGPLVGPRVLNLDNVGMSEELHDKVNKLFSVLLLILR